MLVRRRECCVAWMRVEGWMDMGVSSGEIKARAHSRAPHSQCIVVQCSTTHARTPCEPRGAVSALVPRRGATKPPSFPLFIERQIFRRWTGATGDSAKRPPSSLCTMTRGGEWRRGAALPFLPKPYRPICNALCPDSLSPGRLLSGVRGREGTRQQGRTDMEGERPRPSSISCHNELSLSLSPSSSPSPPSFTLSRGRNRRSPLSFLPLLEDAPTTVTPAAPPRPKPKT